VEPAYRQELFRRHQAHQRPFHHNPLVVQQCRQVKGQHAGLTAFIQAARGQSHRQRTQDRFPVMIEQILSLLAVPGAEQQLHQAPILRGCGRSMHWQDPEKIAELIPGLGQQDAVLQLHLCGGPCQRAGCRRVVSALQDLAQPGRHVLVADDDPGITVQQGAEMPFHHVGRKLQPETGGERGVGFGGVNDLVIGDPLGACEHFGGAVHHPLDRFLVFLHMLFPSLQEGFQAVTAVDRIEFPHRTQHQSLTAPKGSVRGLAFQAHAQAFPRH